MARKEVGTSWDRVTRNAIQDNFVQLFNEYIGAGADAAEAKEKAIQATADAMLAKEDASVAKEMVQQIVDGSIDTGVLNTNIEQRLNDLEIQYAPKLSTVSQQLAQTSAEVSFTELKTNETDYYNLLSRNSTDIGGHTLSVLGDRNFLAKIKLTEDDSVELELRKNGNDDFIKFRNGYLKDFDPTMQSIVKQNYSNVIAGSMTGASGNNHYTAVVGTKIEQVFTGVRISMVYYVDTLSSRSGVWRCYIDGVQVKDISQHPNAVPASDLITNNIAKTEIASGLEDTEHTLVIEFIGADPNNPSDSPRGWIRYNDGSSGDPAYNLESFEWLGAGEVSIPMIYDSNKEFAFLVDTNDTNGNRQWFPEHNNLGTLFAGSQELYVDGIKKSVSEIANYPFREVKIVQDLLGRHPSFTGDVCELTIIATINHLGINFETKVEWLQDAYVHSGYVNMFTLNPKFADTLITSYGGKYDLNIFDNSIEYLNEKIPYYFIAVSNEYKNFYATLTSHNPKRSYRFGEPGIGGKADGTDYFYLQHRSAELQKVYPQTYRMHNVVAGEVFKFDGHFGFGFLPSVANLV